MFENFYSINTHIHETAFYVIDPFVLHQIFDKIPIIKSEVIKIPRLIITHTMFYGKTQQSIETDDNNVN